jgi:WG containing repeat
MARAILMIFVLSLFSLAPPTFNVFAQSGSSLIETPNPVQQNNSCGTAQNKYNLASAQCAPNRHYSEGLALVYDGGIHLTDSVVKSFVRMGYVDTNGNWVISSRFKYFFWYDFSEGVVQFRRNGGRWGYMDYTGKIVIKPVFNWAGSFKGGVAPILTAENACAHINKAGTVIDRAVPLSADPSSVRNRTVVTNRTGVFTSRPNIPPCS